MTFVALLLPVANGLLIAIWSVVLYLYFKGILAARSRKSLMLPVLSVLAIDALRGLFVGFYFGASRSAGVGLLPASVRDAFAQPEMLAVPTLLELLAATLILAILIRYWLPRERGELGRAKMAVDTRTDELSEPAREPRPETTRREQAEGGLEGPGASYFDLYENAPNMYASVNATTARIEACNMTLANTLGYTKDEIIGRPVFDIYHPDCLPEARKAFGSFVETGEIHDRELQLRKKDGSRLDVSLNASAVRAKSGKIVSSRSTLHDITEHKRNKAINAARLHLLQFAARHSLDDLLEETVNKAEEVTDSLIGFYHFVEDDQVSLTLQNWSTRTKAEFCQATGKGMHYPISEAGVWVDCVRERRPLIHNDYASLPHRKGLPEGHAEVIRELVVPVLRGEKIVAILGVGNKPGDYVAKDAEAISLLADLAWEICGRKRTEAELDEHREHLEDLVRDRTVELEIAKNKAQQYLDIAGVILVAIDSDLRVSLINQKGCEILGRSAEQIIGKNWVETFVPVSARSNVIRAFDRLMAGEIEPAEYLEHSVLATDGQERLIAWRNAVLRTDEGDIVGTLSSGEDITEHRRAEDQIRSLNRNLHERAVALEQANRELEAFAYSVSHDLRAPLRHIDGFVGLLEKRMGSVLTEESRHYMATISSSTEKMGLLIDNLLSFSRMGRQAMSLQPVDLRRSVRDVIKEREVDFAGRQIEWRIGDLPVVDGDAAMLRIVLDNLVSNALKFTRRRQRAEIEIAPIPDHDAEVVICVRDNGVGFDMEYAEKLFGVFQRLHRVDEFDGTGIGLANVRRIIARHGGRTWAEGRPGEGARFFFSLPRARLRHSAAPRRGST